jgi:hypothetical protein
MITQQASMATPNAGKYLFKLCKHFARKVPVTMDEQYGEVEFGYGFASLRASASELYFEARSNQKEGLEQVQAVLESHLLLMTKAEPLQVIWQAVSVEEG